MVGKQAEGALRIRVGKCIRSHINNIDESIIRIRPNVNFGVGVTQLVEQSIEIGRDILG